MFTPENLNSFINMRPDSQNFFKEFLRWDQKLHVVNFGGELTNLRKLVERHAGQYYNGFQGFNQFQNFAGLKHFVSHLSQQVEPVVQLDFEVRLPKKEP